MQVLSLCSCRGARSSHAPILHRAKRDVLHRFSVNAECSIKALNQPRCAEQCGLLHKGGGRIWGLV